MKKLIFISLLSLFSAINALGQTYTLDTTRIAWGERATITGRIGVVVGTDSVAEFTAWTDSIGSLEVLEVLGPDSVLPSENDPSEWDFVIEKRWIVTGWDSGLVDVPELAHLGLEVIPTRSEDLIGHAGIVEINWTAYENFRRLLPYFIGALGAIALVLLAIYLAKRFKRGEKEEVIVEEELRPAYEIALEALENLKKRESWNKGEAKTFQVELSRVIRQYIDSRFKVSSLDKTSSEATSIIRMLDISEGDKQGVISALLSGDAIKFAKYKAEGDLHAKSLQACIDFVKNTMENEVA